MQPSAPSLATPHNRYHGFDLLRGICALGVALYHLCLWQNIADYPLLGGYSVYMFFILSGASMVVAYAGPFARGMGMGVFLGRRFFRLAPLYWFVVLLHGHFIDAAPQVALNLTFLFGFADPAISSRVTGGWSLGIEFVFYFLFPCFLALIRGTWQPYAWLALLVVLQLLFIDFTITKDADLVDNVVQYTQFMAFIAYFFGGCLIGRVLSEMPAPKVSGMVVWAVFGAVLAGLFYALTQGTVMGMTGLSGFGFIAGCLLCVYVAGLLPMRGAWAKLAEVCGLLSYGVYLMHPGIFSRLVKYSSVQEQLGSAGFTVLVLAIAIGLSLVLEKYFERPIKKWGYRLLAFAGPLSEAKNVK